MCLCSFLLTEECDLMTNLPRGNEPSDCELFWGALIKRESSPKRQKENSKNFNSPLSEANLRVDVSRLRGLPYMMSARFWDFFTPPPFSCTEIS